MAAVFHRRGTCLAGQLAARFFDRNYGGADTLESIFGEPNGQQAARLNRYSARRRYYAWGKMAFKFLQPGVLADDHLQLRLLVTEPAEQSLWKAPTYRFEIQRFTTNERVGRINLRIGESILLTHYTGHIGYAIDEPHRGHHFAERACRILLPFAARHGMRIIWITCSPDNIASRRTLERLGAELVEIVPVPDDYPLPEGAIRQKCRYRVEMMNDGQK